MQHTKALVEVAAGRAEADLVLKNAQVVNVFTAEILTADVALKDGRIAGVGRYEAQNQRDCTGLFVCPGFIDAHMHIESSMVLPGALVAAVLPSGTTTLVADPHEIVNVAGAAGLRFMLAASQGLPCNLFYMLPSSVPCSLFETAGAAFRAADMQPFLEQPAVLGLGEAMCYPDVVAGRGAIFEKLAALAGRPVDGHAPGLTGNALQAYAAAGVGSEHECTTFAEAAEKARAGLAILVREGSAAHNLKAIVDGLVETGMDTRRFLFCTDDKHLEDIRRDGHIRWNIKLAIDAGLDPVEAIRMGTLNTAQAYGLQGLGAVAAGYTADLVLVEDLKTMQVVDVYKGGVPAAAALAAAPRPLPGEEAVLRSVHLPRPLAAQDFALPVSGPAHVIELVPYSLHTRHLVEAVPAQNGLFAPDATYTKLAVIERHTGAGRVQVAPLKGYGLQGGALATSVAHDSHNIIAAGDSDADLALAVNRLAELGGGYVLVQGGRVAGEVPLPVAGLMSLQNAETVQQAVAAILQKAAGMGIPYHVDPFITLSFLALPVIPSLRLTDMGLFDVDGFALL